MGEKSGGMFMMLVVAVVATIVIAGVKIFTPDLQGDITGGLSNIVNSEFSTNQDTVE